MTTRTSRRRPQTCDRCGLPFVEGFNWPGLGISVQLCGDCTVDLEESVNSYGEDRQAATQRFLARLRSLGDR